MKLRKSNRPFDDNVNEYNSLYLINNIYLYRLKLHHPEISWSNIEKLLTSEGEVFSRAELGDCLVALAGGNTNALEMASYDGASFAEKVLGFDLADLSASDVFQEPHEA